MKKNNKKAFSMIEILIWIFVFTLGITSVYTIISSTIRINDYNKNYIIASNLAREQIEQVRNIRDSNYEVLKPYNLKNPNWTNYDFIDKFQSWSGYTIENDYDISASFPIKVNTINISNINEYQLCLDSLNRYTYDCTTTENIKTRFYKYINIEELEYDDWWTEIINNAFIVKSKIIWKIRWNHEFEVKTIIADWKRL